MIVTWKKTDRTLTFNFEPEHGDQTEKLKYHGTNYNMGQRSCYFDVPQDWNPDETHPDLIGLAVAMIVEPYSSEIKLTRGVSQSFHDKFKELYKKSLLPIDPQLKPRECKPDYVPGLAFSGGVDSTVAALLLPKETVCLFVDRDSDKAANPGRYSKVSALLAVDGLNKLGHRAYAIKTDYQFVRDPVGFGWDVSCAVPAALLADYFKLDSIAMGMILESAYTILDEEIRKKSYPWYDIFAAAGLPCNLVTAGLSEVGTSKVILAKPEYYSLAQSCTRGEKGGSCEKCLKCFRKRFLDLALKGGNLEELHLEKMSELPEVYKQITRSPIHHENVYSFCLSNYRGKEKFLKLFQKKVRARKLDVDWMGKWFSPHKLLIVEKHRKFVMDKIQSFVNAMDSSDEKNIQTWNPYSLTEAKSLSGWFYRRNSEKFKEWIVSKDPKLQAFNVRKSDPTRKFN